MSMSTADVEEEEEEEEDRHSVFNNRGDLIFEPFVDDSVSSTVEDFLFFETLQNLQRSRSEAESLLVCFEHVGHSLDVLAVPMGDLFVAGEIYSGKLQDRPIDGVQGNVATWEEWTPPLPVEQRQNEAKSLHEPQVQRR
mmetsp:Transcript_24800/g.37716  ORF Transcript_24800/g.37716 Transcript_24800/m.37716 type:complete len:139 (+) Transcript_24800:407-823(+)